MRKFLLGGGELGEVNLALLACVLRMTTKKVNFLRKPERKSRLRPCMKVACEGGERDAKHERLTRASQSLPPPLLGQTL